MPLGARIRTHNTPFSTLNLKKAMGTQTGRGGFLATGEAAACGLQRQWQYPHCVCEFGCGPGSLNFFRFFLVFNLCLWFFLSFPSYPTSLQYVFLCSCIQYYQGAKHAYTHFTELPLLPTAQKHSLFFVILDSD